MTSTPIVFTSRKLELYRAATCPRGPLTVSVLLGAAEVQCWLSPHPGTGAGERKSEAGVRTQTTTWGSCKEGQTGRQDHVELTAWLMSVPQNHMPTCTFSSHCPSDPRTLVAGLEGRGCEVSCACCLECQWRALEQTASLLLCRMGLPVLPHYSYEGSERRPHLHQLTLNMGKGRGLCTALRARRLHVLSSAWVW